MSVSGYCGRWVLGRPLADLYERLGIMHHRCSRLDEAVRGSTTAQKDSQYLKLGVSRTASSH